MGWKVELREKVFEFATLLFYLSSRVVLAQIEWFDGSFDASPPTILPKLGLVKMTGKLAC